MARSPAAPSADATPLRGRWWCSRTVGVSLLSGALLWVALPPCNLALFGWMAPVGWLWLARQPTLPGPRPYLGLWLSGFIFWLAAIYWLTLPHWATSFGWLALSAYLACYVPLFVALVRTALHRRGVPLLLAAPLVFTGLELVRAHALGGFLMAALSHTQYRWPVMIQISDLVGAYGLSFLMVLVSAALVTCWRPARRSHAAAALITAALLVAAVWSYGVHRLNQPLGEPLARVALIQGSIDTQMKADPGQAQRVFDEYFGLSAAALRGRQRPDLIVWPETMFRIPWYLFDSDYQPPADAAWTPAQLAELSRSEVASLATLLSTPLVLGVEVWHHTVHGIDRFNSALLVGADGQVQSRYDKVHLVMFGEYVPLATMFPWLYRLTPLASGLSAGERPVAMGAAGMTLAPNICFETTSPHLIRRQVRELSAAGSPPDVLVNLTNDGWFWGSSELDMHLACGVFRAVECRKPLLVAANTGLSAWIDSNGRIVQQGPRRATAVLVAEPQRDPRAALYLRWDDTFALGCLAVCVLVAADAALAWHRRRRQVVAA